MKKKEVCLSKEFILKLNKLPEEAKRELMAYIDFLLERYSNKKTKSQKTLNFNWEGGLKEEKFSSVDLQHKALEWR